VGAGREAESLELLSPGGVLDQDSPAGDALRLTERFGVERRVLGVGAEEIEERTRLARTAEHRIEEDDVEASRGSVPEPSAMVGADDVDEAAGIAAVLRKAAQRSLGESRDDGVRFEGDDSRAGGMRRDESIAPEAQGRVEDRIAWRERGVRDQRVRFALARAEDAEERHPDGRPVHAAALVQIGAAGGEDKHGVSALEEVVERPSRTRFRPQSEPLCELPRLGRIAARRRRHHGVACRRPLASRQA